MIIDCISDLHGYYPKLEGGDLLIIAGDLTARDTEDEIFNFFCWVHDLPYNKKIVIGGNHDNHLEIYKEQHKELHNSDSHLTNIVFLCDSETKFEGLKIWGSPWSPWFHGVNPRCKAFMKSESKLESKFSLIPEDTDILITHTPPFGILDGIEQEDGSLYHAGSTSLRNIVLSKERLPKLKLHIFGHIHENGGRLFPLSSSELTFVNACIMNEKYNPINKPVRVIL